MTALREVSSRARIWWSRGGASEDDVKPAKPALDDRPAPLRQMPGQTVQSSSSCRHALSTGARPTDRSA
jgi:hypothetical protein